MDFKKIGFATLLAVSFGLTDCGGNENEKPKMIQQKINMAK